MFFYIWDKGLLCSNVVWISKGQKLKIFFEEIQLTITLCTEAESNIHCEDMAPNSQGTWQTKVSLHIE